MTGREFLVGADELTLLSAGRLHDPAAAGLREVTRCRDCAAASSGRFTACGAHHLVVPPDGFCWLGRPGNPAEGSKEEG